MIIKQLRVENFLSIGEIEARLDRRGLVLIQGENRDDSSQDSNGAGKSTLVDAIAWGLYGATARGEAGDEVIHRHAKRGDCARVALVLEDDGTQYQIERTRRKGRTELTLARVEPDGTLTDLTKGTVKLTDDAIQKIIGCSAEVFNAAIYAAQERMPDLPAMTDKQLKLLVEEAAGITRIEDAYRLGLEELRALKQSIELAEQSLKHQEALIEQGKHDVAVAKQRAEAWAEERDREVRRRTETLRELKQEHERLRGEVAKKAAEKSDLQAQIAALTKAIEQVAEERERERELERACRNAEKTAHGALKDLEHARNEAARRKRELEQVDQERGKPCPECGRPCELHAWEERKRVAQERLQNALNAYKVSKEHYEEAEKKRAESASELQAYRDSMTDISQSVNARDALQSALQSILDLEQEAQELAQDIREELTALKNLKVQSNPLMPVIADAEAKLAGYCASRDTLSATLAEQRDEQRHLEEAVRVFGPAGVRAYILDTVTPFLNDRTNHYLATLTDGNITAVWSTLDTTKKGDVRERFCIEVQSKIGASSFKGLSGGEKRKVRLACSMALQDLVASRASKPIDLYIADEIDHALDEAGLERLTAILDAKARDRGTVLVISHNSLNDYIRQSVTVVKEGGKSRLEGMALS